MSFSAILGPAGTGKTTKARAILAESPDSTVLTATTGIAAVNLGDATTINSLLGYYDTASLVDLYTTGRLHMTLRKQRAAGLQHILLDEVSMLGALQLSCLTKAIREVNEGSDFDAAGQEESVDRYYAEQELEQKQQKGAQLHLTLTGDFCFAPDTPVMRYDGRIVPAASVAVGDQLMGPDNRPRLVLRTTRGTDVLYQIDQTNGMRYVVNSRHLLALRRSVDGKRGMGTSEYRYPHQGDVQYITAPALQRRSDKFRSCFVGWRVGNLEFPSQPVPIDPYLFGLWLGDGDSDGPRITTADLPVIYACRAVAAQEGWQVRIQRWAKRTTPAVRLSFSARRWRDPQSLRCRLRRLGVLGNKHLPAEYLYNGTDIRLAVLAGLLDSDGSWSGGRYRITQACQDRARQIKQLADQLGFRTGIHQVRATLAWCVTIGGDTWRIPCRLVRKRSVPRALGRSRLTSVLTVTPLPPGPYAGFEVDGDHLFLLGDGTVAHNCQLPPVKAKYAFEAEEWGEYESQLEILTQVHRQQDQDFVQALQHARQGRPQRALEFFEPHLQLKTSLDYAGPTIWATNEAVDRFNDLRHSQLSGEACRFESRREGKLKGEWKAIPEVVQVKEGARVMILANCHLGWEEGRSLGLYYANGDLGTFRGMSESGGYAHVELDRTQQVVNVGWVTRRNTIPLEKGRRKELKEKGLEGSITEDGRHEIIGYLTYMPLRLAYATTCHKAQGLTFDQVQINIGDHFWSTPGMLYVGLSRARSIAGLRLVGTPRGFVTKCQMSPLVKRWA